MGVSSHNCPFKSDYYVMKPRPAKKYVVSGVAAG